MRRRLFVCPRLLGGGGPNDTDSGCGTGSCKEKGASRMCCS